MGLVPPPLESQRQSKENYLAVEGMSVGIMREGRLNQVNRVKGV